MMREDLEIIRDLRNMVDDKISIGSSADVVMVELLLDCRTILGRIEQNTEAMAVRAETLLPAERRSDYPIVEVRETTNASESNQLLRNEWLLIGSSVDPLGESHFLLGRRMK